MSLPRPSIGSSIDSYSVAASDLFVKVALEQLSSHRETRKIRDLKDSCKSTLGLLEQLSLDTVSLDFRGSIVSEIIHPFELACQSKSSSLQSIAIDCIGKLFTYDYWEKLYQYNEDHKKKLQRNNVIIDKTNEDKVNWIDFSIDLICNCFSGGDTNDEIQTQITKALLAAASSSKEPCAIHTTTLLKAVRTTYNIFLLSKSTTTQMIAQASLTQIVQEVFGRIPENPVSNIKNAIKEQVDDNSETDDDKEKQEKLKEQEEEEKEREEQRKKWELREKEIELEIQKKKKLEEENLKNKEISNEISKLVKQIENVNEDSKEKKILQEIIKIKNEKINKEIEKHRIEENFKYISFSIKSNKEDSKFNNPQASMDLFEIMGNQENNDLQICQFFKRTGACRFGNQCDRIHKQPSYSKTIIIRNMFNLGNEIMSTYLFDENEIFEYDEDSRDQYIKYKEFYDDVYPEFLKYGKIEHFYVNICSLY